MVTRSFECVLYALDTMECRRHILSITGRITYWKSKRPARVWSGAGERGRLRRLQGDCPAVRDEGSEGVPVRERPARGGAPDLAFFFSSRDAPLLVLGRLSIARATELQEM